MTRILFQGTGKKDKGPRYQAQDGKLYKRWFHILICLNGFKIINNIQNTQEYKIHEKLPLKIFRAIRVRTKSYQ